MGTITTTTLGELLKRLYASWEIEQLVNLTHPVLADCAKKGSAALGGSGFYFPVRAEAAEGHAYILEGQDLPTGLNSTVLQALVSPTVHAGVVQLTGLSMAVSSGDASSFARGFDENVQSTIEAMTAYKEGAFFRDGTGVIGTFNGNPGTSGDLTLDDANYIRVGMRVDLAESDGSAQNYASVVADVDWVNKTVDLGTIAADVDDNGVIYIAGSQPQGVSAGSALNATVIEPLGLEASLLASGTYLGIARATYPKWQANLMTASAFFDEDILLRARTRVTQEAGIELSQQSSSFAAVCHPMQTDVLFKLAIPRIRYSGNENFDLGNSHNVMFGNIPFKTSYNAPAGTAYLGDWKYSQSLYTPGGELHIDTEYNGSALKWVATKDVGLVFAKEYCQFVVKRPNAFVKISSLTEPSR